MKQKILSYCLSLIAVYLFVRILKWTDISLLRNLCETRDWDLFLVISDNDVAICLSSPLHYICAYQFDDSHFHDEWTWDVSWRALPQPLHTSRVDRNASWSSNVPLRCVCSFAAHSRCRDGICNPLITSLLICLYVLLSSSHLLKSSNMLTGSFLLIHPLKHRSFHSAILSPNSSTFDFGFTWSATSLCVILNYHRSFLQKSASDKPDVIPDFTRTRVVREIADRALEEAWFLQMETIHVDLSVLVLHLLQAFLTGHSSLVHLHHIRLVEHFWLELGRLCIELWTCWLRYLHLPRGEALSEFGLHVVCVELEIGQRVQVGQIVCLHKMSLHFVRVCSPLLAAGALEERDV